MPRRRKYFDPHKASPRQKEAWVHKTFEGISEHYDLMNDLESFGLHRAWKRRLVKGVSALGPKTVLDVACGTGDIALEIARKNPQAQVIGLDFSPNMLEVARQKAGEQFANLTFTQGSALALPFDTGSFDAVAISFGLRNMADYQDAIQEMVRVLRPGGCFFCLEASYPTNPLIKPLFRLYFRYLMPLMAKLVTKKTAEYRWLNDSTEAFLTKKQLLALLTTCGLTHVHYHTIALGAVALHRGKK